MNKVRGGARAGARGKTLKIVGGIEVVTLRSVVKRCYESKGLRADVRPRSGQRAVYMPVGMVWVEVHI